MASQTQIRRANLKDAEQVGVLTERAYRQGGWGSESYSKVLLDGRSRIEDAIVLVATVDGAIVGTVTVALPESRMANVGRGGATSASPTGTGRSTGPRSWSTGSRFNERHCR